jgi:hypothetical protein
MKTLYILTASGGEYDAAWSSVQGVTEHRAVAEAFMNINQFGGVEHEIEIVTQEVMDGKLIDRIHEWLNPAKNPMCKCGHRLLHHRLSKGTRSGSCKHNDHHGPKAARHRCMGFEQDWDAEEPKFDPTVFRRK